LGNIAADTYNVINRLTGKNVAGHISNRVVLAKLTARKMINEQKYIETPEKYVA
jgi:hypothetical protein